MFAAVFLLAALTLLVASDDGE